MKAKRKALLGLATVTVAGGLAGLAIRRANKGAEKMRTAENDLKKTFSTKQNQLYTHIVRRRLDLEQAGTPEAKEHIEDELSDTEKDLTLSFTPNQNKLYLEVVRTINK